jgi:peptide/nickel transport system ATP-binding protein
MTPNLLALPAGCAFRTRCARADADCQQQPPETGSAHTARCFHPLLETVT